MKKKLSSKTIALGMIIPIYFILGLINIQLAIIAMLCYMFAFYIMLKTKSKKYCHNYCIRKNSFDILGKISANRKAPKKILTWRNVFFYYFLISITFVIVSTVSVATGRTIPVETVNFLIVIPVPFKQLFNEWTALSPTFVHLSYRFYSMVLTTFILGSLLAVFYKPRTWCAVCPYGTVSEKYIKLSK